MNVIAEAPLVCACALASLSAWTDATTGRIPNVLTLPMVVLSIPLGLLHDGLTGLASALLGATACFAVPYGVFRASRGAAIGGGDVKLFAALGALLGPGTGLAVQFGSFALFAVSALLLLTWRGHLAQTLERVFWLSTSWAWPRVKRRAVVGALMAPLRMGPAICVATWSTLMLERCQTP
jgi:prepilin peptidase CpaA